MIEERKFGRTIAGEDIVLYSLKNKNGMQADVMNFGAILVNLFVPDKNGEVKDVVLGYDRAKDYFVNGSCFGSTIGPVANRTAKGQFELDGTIYNLIINDNDNNLHSDGNAGLHKTMWQAEKNETENAVTFSVSCKDGLLGFPGNRKFAVTAQLCKGFPHQDRSEPFASYLHAVVDRFHDGLLTAFFFWQICFDDLFCFFCFLLQCLLKAAHRLLLPVKAP